MRTLATKQPSNQDSAYQKPVRATAVPVMRSLSRGLTGSAMLQRKPGCACGGSCPRCQKEALLQTKLKISKPGDQYEQEADHIAEQVMRMPEPAIQLQIQPEVEKEEETLQTQTTSSQPPAVSASLENRITTLQGGGQPLPQSERAFFEPRFGADFSQVRVHTDSQAAETARAVNARAFTVGRDIVFGSGQYQPNVSEGRHLLAHELTHAIQQNRPSNYAPSLPAIQRDLDDDEPPQGFTCGLLEMSQDDFDHSRSCCNEDILNQLDRMREQSVEAMHTAIQRISSGAAIDGLLRTHFGESGPAQRSSILSNIRQTLTVAENFRDDHTYLCRPLSDRFGCTSTELARAGEDTDIIACMGAGSLLFDWTTILHEFFHVSGVAILPTHGEDATPAEVSRGEFETYYHPEGAESDDPRYRRYPSAEPLRNADSYAHLVATLSTSDWLAESTAARFIPGLSVGAGLTFGGGEVEPAVAVRLALTPLGRGLHFITPGVVGLWIPGLGTVDATDPDAAQPRGYVGGELGLRYITGSSSVAGVFELGAGVGSVFRRDESVDVGALVRTSAGVRFGAPDVGVSVNADLMRMFDFALREQRADGWIVGLSVQGHWGGHSGAPR